MDVSTSHTYYRDIIALRSTIAHCHWTVGHARRSVRVTAKGTDSQKSRVFGATATGLVLVLSVSRRHWNIPHCLVFFTRSPLTPEQRTEAKGVVMFVVKDQDFMGMTNEFVSETFVHFKDIPSTQLENDLGNAPQMRLKLTSPKSLGTVLIPTDASPTATTRLNSHVLGRAGLRRGD